MTFLFTFHCIDISKTASATEKEKSLFYFSVLNKFNKFVAEISVHHYYTLSLKGKEKHAQSVFENESHVWNESK